MNVINVNGISIKYENGKLIIDGLNASKSNSKPIKIEKDGTIDGNVEGDINITGNNVTLVIKGKVVGNITGPGDIRIDGKVVGNISGGGSISIGGKVVGNIIGRGF